jgi:hypothetical protein
MSGIRCRSCGQSVIWTITTLGHRMPVNATPDPGGNLHLDATSNPPTVAVINTDSHDLDCRRNHYLSHFATCRDSGQWRKR